MSNNLNELFYAQLTQFLYLILYFDMFEIFLGSSLSRSSTYIQFNYESYTNLICPKLHVSYDKQGLCRRQSALPE